MNAPGPDPAIVQRVCREIPELEQPEITDARAIVLLREWAFRRILAVVSTVEKEGTPLLVAPDAWRMSASEYFELFDGKNAGVICGDTAWILMRIYQAFGFESYTYNYGIGPAATHVVTVVRLAGQLVVQDASFNYDLRDEAGELLELSSVLERLRRHQHGRVSFAEEEPFPDRTALMDDETHASLPTEPAGAFVTARQLSGCERMPAGHWCCRISDHRWTRLRYDPVFGTGSLARLEAGGWLPRPEYLMMYPLGVSSAIDGWTSSDRIAEPTPTAALLRSIYSATGATLPVN